MFANSFMLKGWGLTLTAAPFVLAAKDSNENFARKYFGPEMKCGGNHLKEPGARLAPEVVANFMRKRGYP